MENLGDVVTDKGQNYCDKLMGALWCDLEVWIVDLLFSAFEGRGQVTTIKDKIKEELLKMNWSFAMETN